MKPKFLKRIKSQSEVIFQSPFLKRLSHLERYELLQLSHRRRYKAGEFVYHQGDPGTGLYLIEQGSVELLFKQSQDSEVIPLTVLHSPESFGTFSVDYQIRRKASARCTNDCILYGFFISDYQTLSKRHPRIALKLLETLNVVSVQQFDLAYSRLGRDSEPESYAMLFETYDIPSEESVDEKVQ
ncbi:cyclic nucleotide-binding domain-containing protein [Natronogracilivirga saccharolytica]|uniref:Cyclic nucleotide-binding domain-containing protein n=1 Tax=Natronogracilivirga saccharolytica TaxID=2812953 RepID=A0A8J7RSQ1_9BACT|nr:cyclic nucleotide-binding domain-containing protein [Natronogracilivirga saccharolytica]MBP3193079.1 cyclic nucleotide-binding domain-containing protein [Natronogracilivirga saccharolytica]